jgi:hypothetical protein
MGCDAILDVLKHLSKEVGEPEPAATLAAARDGNTATTLVFFRAEGSAGDRGFIGLGLRR